MSKHVITTRPAKDAAEQKTTLDIDWEGCDEEMLKAFATQALIVKLQSGFRKNGIPAELTVKAKDYAPGTRRVGGGGKFSVEKLNVAELTPDQVKALVAKIKAAGASV